ncbi:16S rRNA (cytosine(1402)-N(4))-methyltransferase RsmH [Geochorda subterranea]|uniref:Ribosomal RNA small subunit methyltransferase H n=1 Tax=Geochorda subterranea TaxID=3109564 RepID=A0ABZ1BTP5_9FIRM|nr:16S rRNA (cytosine(1402)-N(4))-methyltransferase RsmH [Limnochorda sp. LNt]WRP15830.1 16S rRNA (cytosine(1402)-N(4))-methyltransferase RsmH [Limnochorda sp. LNt]
MQEHEAPHRPVMVRQVVELLGPRPGGVYVDATVGAGGHARALLEREPSVRIVGLDRDPEALAVAARRLEAWRDRVVLLRADFSELEAKLRDLGLQRVDGILFDLGVSSLQLDTPGRGFTYQVDEAPLDMRMDPALPLTAADLLNRLPKERLARIFREYGEERWASRIAAFVVEARRRQPLERAGDLVACIKAAVPAAARRTGGHPARRVFQALRIAVNDELGQLERALPQAMRALREGGRLVVISFHSLEDRRVKEALRRAQSAGEPVPMRVLTRKPLTPDAAEAARNPRARSARLRAAERLAGPDRAASTKGVR